MCVFVLAGCPIPNSSIQRALTYLQQTQAKQDRNIPTRFDYAGNWPQIFHFRNVPEYRVPDVSPFVVAFAHHALAHVNSNTQARLGLTDEEIHTAREMRKRAVSCLKRFAARDDAPDAGTFGFWPYDMDPRPRDSVAEHLLLDIMKGPILGGARAPINLPYFPSKMAVPSDADVTGTTYAALLDDQILDGGEGASGAFASLFSDWRDTGAVPLRFRPAVFPNKSGAFLTWLAYAGPGAPVYGNDIDLVVNANVLYALARFGLTDTPGYLEAVSLIVSSITQDLHRTHWDDISLYYPDSYVFHYCVSRAYAEGPVPQLGPAVAQLADELRAEAVRCADGTVFWDKGHPQLNTAFAVLTLLNAGDDTPLIDKAVAYLEQTQNPLTGAWEEAPFFIARADSGVVVEWESAPLTTAIALEAICKARLRGTD